MDKELELAINFKKAPQELQDAATVFYNNEKVVRKLKHQLSQINDELAQAEKVSAESGKLFRSALSAWKIED